MKKKYLRFISMAGFVGLASFLLASCSDEELVPDQGKVVDGITFDVNDVQNMSDANSLPQTKDPSVYETQSSPLKGAGVTGLELVETTVEGVLPIQHTSVTRGLITSDANFTTINKPFAIFGCRDGSATPDFLYNEKINADGTMVNPVQWKRSDAAKLIFYAVHPAEDNAYQRITTTSGQLPIISFKPNEDAKLQTDLLVAKTDEFSYETDRKKKLPIHFNHVTTAIEFKIGNDLSYNQKVKTIEILGVIGEGSYDVANKRWTLGTTTKNYKLTLNPSFSTAADIGAVMNGGDGTFFMIPQTLPANAQVKITFESGKYVQAKIGGKDKSGNDKKWVEGTTKTYTISNSKDTSDREFILTVTPTKDLGDGTTTRKYNEFDVPFTVTSYRHLKGYTGTDRDKAEPWEISKYEYSEDSLNWTEGKPSMVSAITDRGDGGTSAQLCNLKLSDEYKDFKATRIAQLKAMPEITTRRDLSLGANNKQSSANCYIVSAGGKYKIPLYYGNAWKDGQKNEQAYNPAGVSANDSVLKPFRCSTGNITKPKIEGADGAKVLWCSEPDLVTLEGNGLNGTFLEFNVDKTKMTEASAVIAVTKGTDQYNVLWSWHIWITSNEVIDTSNGYFMREPLGFRHTKWGETSYKKDRFVRLTFVQKRSGQVAKLVVKQKPYAVNEGVSMFYQQGRKDPLWYERPFFAQSKGQNKGYNLETSVRIPWGMANSRRISYDGESKGNWDWLWDQNRENSTYFNLWDGRNNKGFGYNKDFLKTVYDPSPAGFHVPRSVDFEKIKNGNNGKPVTVPMIGRLNPDDFTGIKDNKKGYYWSTERRLGPGNTPDGMKYYGYYGILAWSMKENGSDFFGVYKTGETFPIFSNMSWGYSVIPIKEE